MIEKSKLGGRKNIKDKNPEFDGEGKLIALQTIRLELFYSLEKRSNKTCRKKTRDT